MHFTTNTIDHTKLPNDIVTTVYYRTGHRRIFKDVATVAQQILFHHNPHCLHSPSCESGLACLTINFLSPSDRNLPPHIFNHLEFVAIACVLDHTVLSVVVPIAYTNNRYQVHVTITGVRQVSFLYQILSRRDVIKTSFMTHSFLVSADLMVFGGSSPLYKQSLIEISR